MRCHSTWSGVPAFIEARTGNQEISGEESTTTDDTQFTVGKTTFFQGEHQTHPLFRIEPGIPCRDAHEQASELMGYVRELTIIGLMDEKPMMIWASHYLSAMAKALMDDAELGMTHKPLGD